MFRSDTRSSAPDSHSRGGAFARLRRQSVRWLETASAALAARASLRRVAGVGAVALLALSNVTPETPALGAASGKVYLTLDEALKLALPECTLEKRVVYLTKEQLARVALLAGCESDSAIARPYIGTKDGKLVGTVYVDAHKVRTSKETLLVLVAPDGKVARIELLAFGEPEEYAPKAEWYAQFVGKVLDDELELRRGLRGIAGASLSARATTNAVRRMLALHKVLGEVPKPEEKRL